MPDLDMGAPFDVILFSTLNQKTYENVFIDKDGKSEVCWNGDTPSHKTGWKEVDDIRVPCVFYIGFGFMTSDEIWEHRQKWPRDSI